MRLAKFKTRPSKSELAYIYCKAQAGHNDGHDPSRPQEDPNCVTYGGKTRELTGFSPYGYWTSTEYGSSMAFQQTLTGGTQSNDYKVNPYYVRCIRRF